MAEAANVEGGADAAGGRENDQNARFYCHKCSLQILPVLPVSTTGMSSQYDGEWIR